VLQDGSGPTYGKLKAMIDPGQISWGLVDGDIQNMILLQDSGALQPIDYAIVDRNKVLPGDAWDYGVNNYMYSDVLAYDTEKTGGGEPSTWADFFDTAKYPGKRAIWQWGAAVLEITLLADGVPPDQLYPVDVARAKAKLESIKDDLVLWSSGADSQQYFYRGEIAMAMMWNGRAFRVMSETENRVRFTFNQGILVPGVFNIMTGGPAGPEWVNRFIADWQDPARQAEFFRCIGYGPANPEATDLLSVDEQRLSPSSRENIALQVPLDPAWLAEHEVEAIDTIAAVVGS